jgi:hypothetical protein
MVSLNQVATASRGARADGLCSYPSVERDLSRSQRAGLLRLLYCDRILRF